MNEPSETFQVVLSVPVGVDNAAVNESSDTLTVNILDDDSMIKNRIRLSLTL